MLRRICLLAGVVLFMSLSASAQSLTDKVEVFGGYSFLHADTSPSFNTNGWEIAGHYKLFPWLGAAADIDGHYGTIQGVHAHLNNYLFGPQVSLPMRVSPFAHALFGTAHFGGAGVSNSSFASGFGFGIDTGVAPFIAWRIVQFDLIHSHLFSTGQNNTRLSTGIVFRF